MAIDQLGILKQGVKIWNEWRKNDRSNSNIRLFDAFLLGQDLRRANLAGANLTGADLTRADLRGANLTGAELYKANLTGANLTGANLTGAGLIEAELYGADLSGASLRGANLKGASLGGAKLGGADLRRADLRYADLRHADLHQANLTGAYLTGANLTEANLTEADLTEANLISATLIEVNIQQTILKGCLIYGLSVWNLKGIPQDQSDLIITRTGEPLITVDDIQVAQFIHLLLNNKNVRNVIDTITSKAVLILGRFTPERKIVLDTIANELRKNNLLPIIFDFDRPVDRDFTETIKTLAGLSLFIIADITNPKSSPLELQATIPDYQIPFVTIIQQNEKPFSMFSDLQSKYDWVLPAIEYDSVDSLIVGFEGAILNRAWSKHQELQLKKANEVKVLSIKDFIKENGI